MFAIFKREFKSYFTSLWGYVFLAAFLIIAAYVFIMLNITYSYGGMTPFFQQFITLVMFVLPILTMRLFAEDRKQKTDQLLFTSPVSSMGVAIGKFLSVFAVFLVGVIIMLLYPLALSFYGDTPVAETMSAFVGFALFSGAILAIGMFMSSLTESQVIAAISTYAIIITMFILPNFVLSNISNPVLSEVVGSISLLDHFNDFTIGVLNLESLIYYASFIVVFVFLTGIIIERRRFS